MVLYPLSNRQSGNLFWRKGYLEVHSVANDIAIDTGNLLRKNGKSGAVWPFERSKNNADFS